MKTVYDLSSSEFEELRERYYWQFVEGDSEIIDDDRDYMDASEVPDDVLYQYYEGRLFSENEFSCNERGRVAIGADDVDPLSYRSINRRLADAGSTFSEALFRQSEIIQMAYGH